MLAFIGGFFVAAFLDSAIVFVGIAVLASPLSHYKTPSIVFAATIGLWQWLYLAPMIVRAWRRGKRAYPFGLITAGAVGILLVSPCFGFMGAERYGIERWQRDMVRAIEDPATNAEAFSTLLGEKPDLSTPLWGSDGMPRSPLEAAVQADNATAAQALLERGAWANEPTGLDRRTLLYVAIERCEPRVAALLIAKGAKKEFAGADLAELTLVEKHCAGKPDSEQRRTALTPIVQSLQVEEPAKP